MFITYRFSGLNNICQSCDHLNILLRSFRITLASWSSPTALHSIVSSANFEISDKIPSSMPLMKSTNNSRPNTDLCFTPLSTVIPLEWLCPMPTFCLLPDSQLWTQVSTCPLIPRACKFGQSFMRYFIMNKIISRIAFSDPERTFHASRGWAVRSI